jgi:hypothetical protein
LFGTDKRRLEFYIQALGASMERRMEHHIALILLVWFALQMTLGILVGKCIHFGLSEDTKRQTSSPSRFGQGTWWRGDSVPPGWRIVRH